ncbi:unnamed protein product [Linum trigynum]|uniref:Uncharacterized protein n=1 Tax=Linum trigynum TaxID=586398 RepID=A0AAV2DSU4_9ROSI
MTSEVGLENIGRSRVAVSLVDGPASALYLPISDGFPPHKALPLSPAGNLKNRSTTFPANFSGLGKSFQSMSCHDNICFIRPISLLYSQCCFPFIGGGMRMVVRISFPFSPAFEISP